MPPEENNEGITSKAEPEPAGVEDLEDIEAVKQALAEEKEKAEGYLANWQRAQADFINYKRRSEQEREEVGKFATSVLMLNLLPVLDDLERALGVGQIPHGGCHQKPNLYPFSFVGLRLRPPAEYFDGPLVVAQSLPLGVVSGCFVP